VADWYKQRSAQWLDPEVAGLSADAECLLYRASQYVAQAETHGLVPTAVLPRLIRNATPKRIKAVCAELTSAYPEPLWDAEPGGYRLRKWDEEQSELEALLQRRAADAARARAYRRRQRQSPGQGVIPGTEGVT
jgi:hypothetical protein